MALINEITAALRAGSDNGLPRVNRQAGAHMLLGLGRAFGLRVKDRTGYPAARAYRLDIPVSAPGREPWHYSLRVLVSAAGPYCMQVFVKSSTYGRWWSNALQTNRNGFHPGQREALEQLRSWYRENGLTEVDPNTQALPAPSDPALPGLRDEATIYHALFGL